MKKKKLLWCGDAVRQTGFSRATHNILDRIQDEWDISVLAINYGGDPHKYNYPIYPAVSGNDVFGFDRYPKLVKTIHPDLVFILNDAWNIARFLKIREEHEVTAIPHMGFPPVDALNMRRDFAEWLNELHTCFFCTEFGLEQARKAGFTGRSVVIPYGVDLGSFKAVNKGKALKSLRDRGLLIRYTEKNNKTGVETALPPYDENSFIVGNVNRNQPRKRMDLTIQFFSEWLRTYDIQDAFLYFHCSPVEVWCDLVQMAQYWDVLDRMIMPCFKSRIEWFTEEDLNLVYNIFDVQVTTTVGEGWGLPHMEGMACEVPQIVPEFAALGEWPRGGVKYVPIAMYGCAAPGVINTISGLPDKNEFVRALHELYIDKKQRIKLGKTGAAIARRDAYNWDNIAEQFNRQFREALK